jgi:VPDSG-CTERM motif
LAFGVLAGLPSAAQAIALDFDDAYDLGWVNPGEPADIPAERGYVNNLIGLAQGSGAATIDGHDYFRKNASCGTCPAATGGFKDDSGLNVVNLGTGGFTYLIAKYDGPNGGSEVWNVQGLTGVITIPLFGLAGQNFGLSHWTLFGGGGGQVPDGGATVMLLGAALGTLGVVRRYLIR